MTTYQDSIGVLGDTTRRAIFERVGESPCAVGELAREFPITRPAVSQHLRVLKDAGLVTDTAVGTRRVYQLDPGGIRALRAYVDRFWDKALEAFKEAAEREKEEGDD